MMVHKSFKTKVKNKCITITNYNNLLLDTQYKRVNCNISNLKCVGGSKNINERVNITTKTIKDHKRLL